jgi:hypothetical protein
MTDVAPDPATPVPDPTPVAPVPDPDLDQVKSALAGVAGAVKAAFVKDVLAAIADLAKEVP